MAARPGHATADTSRNWTSSTSTASTGSWGQSHQPGDTSPFQHARCWGLDHKGPVQMDWQHYENEGQLSSKRDLLLWNGLWHSQAGGQTKCYKDSFKNSLGACDIPIKGLEHLAADHSAWRLATQKEAKAFEERWLSQFDIKHQASKERKVNPAVALASLMCGHICTPESGLWSHTDIIVTSWQSAMMMTTW